MDLLRIALIIGGGYFVLRALGVDVLQGIGPLQTNTEPLTEGDTVVTNLPGHPSTTPVKTVERNLRSEMLAIAKDLSFYQTQDGMMNYDHWNWVYKQVTGSFGPNWETVVQGQPRDALMALEGFLGLVGSRGISGMGATEAAGYERSNVYFE